MGIMNINYTFILPDNKEEINTRFINNIPQINGINDISVPFTLSSGIDYESYMSTFQKKDSINIMKSFVAFSKEINAFVTGILTPVESEYIIDI